MSVVDVVVQGLESNVLIPIVMKRAVDIPPAVSLFTLILWGKILGVSGLLLAIPIDLVIWNLLKHFVMRDGETGLFSDRPQQGAGGTGP